MGDRHMRKLALLWMMVPALASAQAQDVPLKLGFQGRLVASDGTALGGVKNVTFSIYKGPTDSAALWTETQKLALTNGFYSTFLGMAGQLSASSLATGSDLFVGITVDGTELAPRQQIGSVVYAFRASHAVNADHATSADQATNATTASSAQNATNANHAANADQATSAAQATNAAHATNADTAGYAGSAGTATNLSGGSVNAISVNAQSASIPGLVIGAASGVPYTGDAGGYCNFTWGNGTCDGWGNVGCSAGAAIATSSTTVLCIR
jgi:hypothetical protein